MTDSVKVLVTGATGNIGGAVVNALLDKGFAVRAGSQTPENASYPSDVEKVRLVYSDKDSVKTALRDVDAVYLIAPPMDPMAEEVLIPFIDIAKEAGVEHIILNFSFGVELEEDDALRITEKYLINSGVNYTIFRPNFIMENFSSGFITPMVKEGGIYLAAADSKTSFISVKDIGKAAACTFKEKIYGKEFNLNGPVGLTHSEVAIIISKYSGTEIQYYSLSEEKMLNSVREQGMPEPSVQMLGGLYHITREGVMARLFDDVEKITGTSAQTFEDFAAGINW